MTTSKVTDRGEGTKTIRGSRWLTKMLFRPLPTLGTPLWPPPLWLSLVSQVLVLLCYCKF